MSGQQFPRGADPDAAHVSGSFTADQGLKYDAATGLFVPADFLTSSDLAVESPAAVSYATGWSDFGTPYSTAGYYKDRERVYLRGGVKNNGSGTSTILTLPSGYRPPDQVDLFVVFFNGTGTLRITSAGVVTDQTFSSLSKILTLLEGVSFRAA
jgi:hypothetical protein